MKNSLNASMLILKLNTSIEVVENVSHRQLEKIPHWSIKMLINSLIQLLPALILLRILKRKFFQGFKILEKFTPFTLS